FTVLSESYVVKDKIVKRVNVYAHEPGWLTLEEIIKRKESLDPRHLVWMLKRLLTAIRLTNKAGYVHGAILPQHVLIQPESHTVKLIGWTHAVKIGEK